MILVISPPRCGSSAIAGVLHHLGVDMGRIAGQQSPHNPKGHFEDWDFRCFTSSLVAPDDSPRLLLPPHEGAIAGIKARVASRPEVAGYKDPLLCFLGGYFIRPGTKFIFPHRQVRATMQSFQKMRNKPLPQLADAITSYINARTNLWISHQDIPVLDVWYDNLVERPLDEVHRIARFVGLPVTQEALGFIDANLRHHV